LKFEVWNFSRVRVHPSGLHPTQLHRMVKRPTDYGNPSPEDARLQPRKASFGTPTWCLLQEISDWRRARAWRRRSFSRVGAKVRRSCCRDFQRPCVLPGFHPHSAATPGKLDNGASIFVLIRPNPQSAILAALKRSEGGRAPDS